MQSKTGWRAWAKAPWVRRSVVGVGLAGLALTMAACSTNEAPTDRTAMLPEDQRVSNVPWNKPQSWEGQGQLGALANNPRITGGDGTAR